MPAKWEAENQARQALREQLRSDPANLEIADRYYAPASKSGSVIVDVYRQPALSSIKGVIALARAQRQLFLDSGEPPRRAYLDEQLLQVLGNSLAHLPDTDRITVRWVLESLR